MSLKLTDIDDAMEAIEKDNPSLIGGLPKDYARPTLDKKKLGGRELEEQMCENLKKAGYGF